jgi:acid phosphatase
MNRLVRCGFAVALLLLCASSVPAAAQGVPDLRATPHVYLIIGENTEITQVNKSNAPFLLTTLKPQAAWLTNYFAITHFSEANYVGMMAGQFTKCHQGDLPPVECHEDWNNLFHQLGARGVSWLSWMESMPSPCALANAGGRKTLDHYVAKHNPALFFNNVEGVGGEWSSTPGPECRQRVISTGPTDPVGPNDMSTFNRAVQAGETAQFNLVVPNECEDGHDNCEPQRNRIAQFDAFLRQEVPLIRTADPDALIMITFDEGTSNKGPSYSKQFAGGGNVAFLALGPAVHPGIYDAPSNHYGLLRTLETGYGVPLIAGARGASTIDEIWNS